MVSKKSILLLLAVMCIGGLVYWTSKNNLPQSIDRYVQTFDEKFSGVVFVAKNGNVIFEKAYGLADREKNIANTPQTIFKIGSVSKSFTGLLIMRLMQKGLLKEADKLSQFLPWYKRGDEITIEHLLTHTSGITNIDEKFMPQLSEKQATMKNLDEVIDLFKDMPLQFMPGEKFDYSNSGYILLTYIAEKLTGKSYGQLIHEYITDPLGMTHTGVELSGAAQGYIIKDGKFLPPENINMAWVTGTGGLYSTVEDLYKLDQALYSELLLSKNEIQKMFTPHKNNYGYGWMNGTVCNRHMVGHIGSISGFTAANIRFVDDKACVIILSNINKAPVEEMAIAIAQMVFGCKNEPVK